MPNARDLRSPAPRAAASFGLLLGGLVACGSASGLGADDRPAPAATGSADDAAPPDPGATGPSDGGVDARAPRPEGDAAPATDASAPPWMLDGGADVDGGCAEEVLSNGRCLTTLASGQDRPMGIAIDARYVYWANAAWTGITSGSIARLPRSGRGPVAVVAAGLRSPRHVAADGADVYWTGSSIQAAGEDSGAVRTLFDDSNSTTAFVTRSGARVFWADDDFDFALRSAFTDGSGLLALTRSSIGGIAASPTGIVFTKTSSLDSVKDTLVAWAGGQATVLLTTHDRLGLVASAGDVVAYQQDFNSLYAMPLAGGAPTFLSNGAYPTGLVTDGTYVYWTDANLRAVMRVAIASGAPEALVSYEDDVRVDGSGSLAIDATNVYFTESTGAVLRLAPR